MANRFALVATLSDGFKVTLAETYDTHARADRAACDYITHYSDPCGLGVSCSYVSVIDTQAVREAA